MSESGGFFGKVSSIRGPRLDADRFASFAGVTKEILAEVPEEKQRYAAMGAAVLGTACLGSLSMLLALSQIFDGFNVSMLIIVPLWGLVIFNLDRWLVLTPVGDDVWDKVAVLVPRLLLAGIFGVVIAEPLLLGIFNSAIEEQVVISRQAANLDLEGSLRNCNPLPDATPDVLARASSETCSPFRLSVVGDPIASSNELNQLRAQAAQLSGSLKEDTDRLGKLNQLARNECTGVAGEGLTGVPGVAGECTRLRDEADTFGASKNIAGRTAELDEVNKRLGTLSQTVGQQSGVYSAQLNERIAAELSKREDSQGTIGLLERFQAFSDLRERSSYVEIAAIFLRIFLIVVDCVPVLFKFLSSGTSYDTMLDVRRKRRQKEFVAAEDVQQRERLNLLDSTSRTLASDDAADRERAGAEGSRLSAEARLARRREVARLRDAFLAGDSSASAVPPSPRTPQSNGSMRDAVDR